jgi:hypothetical protein
VTLPKPIARKSFVGFVVRTKDFLVVFVLPSDILDLDSCGVCEMHWLNAWVDWAMKAMPLVTLLYSTSRRVRVR